MTSASVSLSVLPVMDESESTGSKSQRLMTSNNIHESDGILL